MQQNPIPQNSSLNRQDLIAKGGPAAGGGCGMIGALLALVGFLLPWASCGPVRLNGLDIVTQSNQLNSPQATLLCLIPLFAAGAMGMALLVIPASFWKKIPNPVKIIGSAATGFLALLGLCLSCAFFAALQSARNDPKNMGMGTLIQIESGFWVTVFGFFVASLGALLGVVTALAGRFAQRKR